MRDNLSLTPAFVASNFLSRQWWIYPGVILTTDLGRCYLLITFRWQWYRRMDKDIQKEGKLGRGMTLNGRRTNRFVLTWGWLGVCPRQRKAHVPGLHVASATVLISRKIGEEAHKEVENGK